jgi:phage shock protein C
MPKKKLCRSSKDKILFGVCGGIAEYFDADPLVARLGFILLAFVTGLIPGLIFYLIAAILMPTPKRK